jgi:hypothetical protein
LSDSDSDALPHLLESKLADATSKRQDIAAALEEVSRAEDVWKRLLEAQKHGRLAEVVSIFRKGSDVFTALRERGDEAVLLLDNFYKEAEEAAKNTARRFTALFPNACDAAGIRLDSSSRHPKYSVREFIQIVVIERTFEVEITPRDATSVSIPLDIDPVVAYLRAEVRRLFETKRQPKRFLSRLWTAYQAVLREEEKSPGDELPLRRVANRLSKNLSDFRYDEFNVDLGNAVRSGETSIDNMRLHLNHTRDMRQGLLLYGLERSGYMGFISFKLQAQP